MTHPLPTRCCERGFATALALAAVLAASLALAPTAHAQTTFAVNSTADLSAFDSIAGGEQSRGGSGVIFDDMEHGDPFGNGYFVFGGSVGGGGIGTNNTDLPPMDGGTFSLNTSWASGGEPGFFGGFGRTNPVDLSGTTYFSFWINPDAGQDYVLEINLQDDDNGDNNISPPEDDEFQYDCVVSPMGPCAVSGGGWQRVEIPLADFFDDNSFLTGGNGVLDAVPTSGGGNGQLINVVFAVIGNSGSDVSFRTDYWAFGALPESLVVTTVTDEDDGTSDPGTGTGTSLREAINYANANPGDDTITFAPSVQGQSIMLAAGAGFGQLNLNDNVVIDAEPGGVTLDAGQQGIRVMAVNTGVVAELVGLTLTGGQVTGEGGGIVNLGGTLTVTRSTISGNNTAFQGGGIVNVNGALTVTQSTISGNFAFRGGGIVNVNGALTVTQSTISGNSAPFGGGIENQGTLTVGSTVFERGANGENIRISFGGTVASEGFNVSDDATGPNNGTTDQINTDPLLGPLADNGGPTLTHALLAGSPAIDIGGTCGPTDQRGFDAPTDGDGVDGVACDAGSVEAPAFGCSEDLIISDFAAFADGNSVELRNTGALPVNLAACSFVATYNDVYVALDLGDDTVAPGASVDVDPGAQVRNVFGGLALLDRADAPALGTAITDLQADLIASLVYLGNDVVFGFYHRDADAFAAQCDAYIGGTRLGPFAVSQCSLISRGDGSGDGSSDGPVALTHAELTEAMLTAERGATAIDGAALPTAFGLSAAYPNPMQERGTVTVDVPAASDVRVVVYDVLGRSVATLLNEAVEAGRYTVTLDASSLAPGTYLVRMTAGGYAATQRVTVVR